MRNFLFTSVFLCTLLCTTLAWAADYPVEGDLAGSPLNYRLKISDTVFDIARASDLGLVEFLAANPSLDPDAPKVGMKVILPKEHVLPLALREGIVINLAEMRLYYFPTPDHVVTYPVSIGRVGWETQTGSTSIVSKRKDPTWTPPDSIRAENPNLPLVIPAGPENPLGAYAMNLGWQNFIIHGTSNPSSIGRRLSHGCIRLYPEDIEALFNQVSIGTKVTVVDQPFKLGWKRNTLYLEITPLQPNREVAVAEQRYMEPTDIPGLVEALGAMMNNGVNIDQDAVENATKYHNGRPTAIADR